jgi:ABC-type antimicrobial peptide transport system permease subunit
MSGKNLEAGHPWKDEFDIGLIVTRQLLNNLGYLNDNPSYIFMSYPIMGNEYIEVPIPVVAVVTDLPGNNLFACTPYFYQKRNSRYYPFDISSENYQCEEIRYFTKGRKSDASLLARNIYGILNSDRLFNYYRDTLILPNDYTLNKGYDIIFKFNDNLVDSVLIHSFVQKIKQNDHIIKAGALRIYNFDLSGFENESYSYDNLSVSFNSLDKIREFSFYLFKLKNLKIDMSQIESKENYNFVSKLTIFISGFLVIFSVISIILFLSNVLKVHINKIKSNLGTFKAFGMSNPAIVKIYSILTMRFLFYAIFVSFFISLLIGETGLFRLLFRMSGTTIDENIKYFDLLSDSKTYLALIAVILTSLIVLPWNIWRMLDKTPGDLIYKRD